MTSGQLVRREWGLIVRARRSEWPEVANQIAQIPVPHWARPLGCVECVGQRYIAVVDIS